MIEGGEHRGEGYDQIKDVTVVAVEELRDVALEHVGVLEEHPVELQVDDEARRELFHHRRVYLDELHPGADVLQVARIHDHRPVRGDPRYLREAELRADQYVLEEIDEADIARLNDRTADVINRRKGAGVVAAPLDLGKQHRHDQVDDFLEKGKAAAFHQNRAERGQGAGDEKLEVPVLALVGLADEELEYVDDRLVLINLAALDGPLGENAYPFPEAGVVLEVDDVVLPEEKLRRFFGRKALDLLATVGIGGHGDGPQEIDEPVTAGDIFQNAVELENVRLLDDNGPLHVHPVLQRQEPGHRLHGRAVAFPVSAQETSEGEKAVMDVLEEELFLRQFYQQGEIIVHGGIKKLPEGAEGCVPAG